jgi:tRNA-2-methylthio-N6-dimethylallyladenosine synthase
MEEALDEQKQYTECIREMIADKQMGYSIQTLGCQMNESDSEHIAGMLRDMGYIKAASISEASIIVFNTCCVRENAEFKLLGHIGEIKKLKEINSGLITVICGCMMQEEHITDKIRKSYKFIDIVFGTHNRHVLPKLVYQRMTAKKRIFDIWEEQRECFEGTPVERSSSITAYVPIMYGCNNFCSYCIVPYVRGREISRKPYDIREEVTALAKNGIKEIILLGQNVNSYESDMDFTRLLYDLSDISGIERIRFMTSHPKDLSDDLIEAIANIPTVCKHIHLPLQSGSTKVLKEMNRHYTKESYLTLIDRIRSKIPGVTLSTDIIVGFPGETEEDFNETLDVINRVAYDFTYTFIYSKRVGTPAEKREDQIPDEVKDERFGRLKKIVDGYSLTSNMNDVGHVLKVLVEGPSKTNANVMSGRTESNKIVNFICDPSFTGSMVDVKIVKGHTWHLEGEKI